MLELKIPISPVPLGLPDPLALQVLPDQLGLLDSLALPDRLGLMDRPDPLALRVLPD